MDSNPDSAARAAALALEIRTVASKLKRRLREQASGELVSTSQISVILRLDRGGPATASHLARAEAMRPQSMASIVAALAAAGLVTATADPGDGRQTLWSLSDRGRQWLRARRAARQDWLTATIIARLSPPEQQALAAALPLLDRLAD